MTNVLPELLAPAGTREALDAAIRSGADAVYFGGSRFNARMGADNFDDAAMEDAIRTCAFWGVKSNITLNTLPTERELPEVLRYAEKLATWGADAVICADLGTAVLLHRYFPELALHASTQCQGHNTDAARFFAALGFQRMVAARELSFADLHTLCSASPIETELFIHGALCVSQSGGCLFSSLVGGRSGNRGACAQPCRLPYQLSCKKENCTSTPHAHTQNKKNPAVSNTSNVQDYPLSLKDYCLAGHVTELLSLGAASFKIEGRMKGPAYVEGVVRIWRRLLDERRNAEPAELFALADLFSRGGSFSDDYFRGVTGASMRGIRTEADKEATVKAEKRIAGQRIEGRKIPVAFSFCAEAGTPMTLTMGIRDIIASDYFAHGKSVTVTGEIPETALTRPTTEEDVRGCLFKLGATPFKAEAAHAHITIGCGLSVPLAAINRLRREAAEKLEERLKTPTSQTSSSANCMPPLPINAEAICRQLAAPYTGDYPFPRQASFLFYDRIPPEALSYYDIRYLPLDVFDAHPMEAQAAGVNGIMLPPVIFDSEQNAVLAKLQTAASHGITHALIANPGHLALAGRFPFQLHGDLRLNLWTAHSANVFASSGLCDCMLSPELSLSQMRDIKSVLPHGAVTYGRLPMMTLQRCIIREREQTRASKGNLGSGKTVPSSQNRCTFCDTSPVSYLLDRRRTVFPVTRTFGHRNIIWNAAPVYMADKKEVLARANLAFVHHIFTTETRAQIVAVINAYKDPLWEGVPYEEFGAFRRM